ncbi:MAG: ribose-5-phosphate isomerase RpiA [SAR324 cluster bacterium]|jgi:ribose 5-phosphate isomerase A|uniref:ribose-5-phosphate isomerase n=1 Tax=marine metagenome TaxID=408172 RepID=A0A381PAY3_9ZZZZ|nr:ribose 5-phosphate isomerase A [Deltaproteobacteria bacterium]MDP6307883.1 ribose-5-phosphate isomerase RpiA [SAR324 cluster bacterium]MDP6486908.1 ribose-5-phosphate isomerase RpiA [SAR324 cluster bacterium]MDP7170770.1 ribose-5-phosphate isomerase RpiA [SAR324 cluster bacterium]MDP7176097.1 ribose-5-phosphate isomerase RpiA [SAR324 cluster bacterium]|tara:strand:- start:7144 stop:7821 length:678 start_codon:yes stop_codon:yes gene_type:complete
MISEKQRAAEAAVEYVKDGMIVGLGTGSTTEFAVKKLGERVRDGLAIRGIPTSDVTKVQAEEEGIPLIDFSETMYIDLTIDGADEIDINLNMIKGGGAALLREKIVASASKEEIIIVSHEKFVKQLGSFPLPVEVIPFGWQVIFNQLETLGGSPDLRLKQGQPLLTDQGNYIIDCRFRQIIDASQLEQRLNMIPGVVENGLFTGLCTRMIMAEGEKIVVKERGIK